MDISIIIPTARPFEGFSKVVVDNINGIPARHSYEIVIVSNEEVSGDNVVWLKEDGRRGPIWAFNYATQISRSKYCIFLTDDHALTTNFSDGIDFLATEFKHSRFPINTLSGNPPSLNYNPTRGELLGYSPVDFEVQRHPLCKFPIFERERALDALGGFIFHPNLFYHAGDILLGYYMGMKGEPCIGSPVTVHEFSPSKDSSYEHLDCEIVKNKIREYHNENSSYI
tara:strand:+ start:666 stop:1343 length:678 start_codon:yes stop_codon:yes gene_type:complete